jgi:Lon-like ATP-dependent protease
VKWYSDVFDLVFPNLNEESVNNRWKAQLTKKEKDHSEKLDGEDEL